MSVSHYRLRVLEKTDFRHVYPIADAIHLIRCWRTSHATESVCAACKRTLTFEDNFTLCCRTFYFKPCVTYVPQSIAVDTGRVHFLPPYLRHNLSGIEIHQQFLVLPDPIYWQVSATLTYEQVLQFVSPESKKHNILTLPETVVKKSRVGSFGEGLPAHVNHKLCQYYTQVQNAQLNHCSISHRSQGKFSLYRMFAIAKRAENTARAMIVPAPFLRPNEVVLPAKIVEDLNISGWVILNRMPSLLPENFSVHYVAMTWEHACIGVPCEILQILNGDFDGDEINIFPLRSPEAQAECQVLMNTECNMGSFSSGLKLYPSQDMLVTFYLKRRELRHVFPFDIGETLPLPRILRMVNDLHGSKACFDCFDQLRRYYLYATEYDFSFSLTLEEFEELRSIAVGKTYEEFEAAVETLEEKCLLIQVKSGAKGKLYHIYQLVGAVGEQLLKFTKLEDTVGEPYIWSSFYDGLTAREYIIHAQSGSDALVDSINGVWIPGYNYFKLANNLQDLIVNYLGQLVDKGYVISSDALNVLHCEDAVSKDTFLYLFLMFFQK